MPIIDKSDENFPKSESVTVNGKPYKPDYCIKYPVDNDTIDIDNCICVFSIRNRDSPKIVKYVGATTYDKLTKDNVIKKVNGYLPDYVQCFTETEFPLDDFIKEQNFKYFGQV